MWFILNEAVARNSLSIWDDHYIAEVLDINILVFYCYDKSTDGITNTSDSQTRIVH